MAKIVVHSIKELKMSVKDSEVLLISLLFGTCNMPYYQFC